MPKALGEFGKSRNSEVSHKVISVLDGTLKPMPFKDIWRAVHQDLEARGQLVEILSNLQLADKIQSVADGFLPVRVVKTEGASGAINWDLLTKEERDLV